MGADWKVVEIGMHAKKHMSSFRDFRVHSLACLLGYFTILVVLVLA